MFNYKRTKRQSKLNKKAMQAMIGSDTQVSLDETTDGQGYHILISGTFRDGGNGTDYIISQLKECWNKIDIDAS